MPGRPSPDDPRRCKARRRSGEQCARWAMRDSEYCPFHGGRSRKRIHLKVPRFYSKYLGLTLRRAVDRAMRVSPAQQLSLFEELALMRAVAAEAVALFAAATETGKAELKANAAVVMSEALDNVRSMCESASRVASAGADRVSVHNVTFVINQVVRIVYKVLGDEGREEALAIATALEEELLVDDGRPQSVSLTPASDVADMIDTVPAEPAHGEMQP